MTGTEQGIEVPERLAEITAAHARIREDADAITEDQARAPISLPGWTRGHVLIHLADLSKAFARQARYAPRGERIEVYDGGRETRNKSIEANHGRPVAWLREQLHAGLDEIEAAWAALSPSDWDLPCAYRDSPLLATQMAWWRETELHLVDLETGYTGERWSLPLAAHVVTFLRPRLPEGSAVALHATDTGARWRVGEGDPVTVSGDQRALAAWISGRPTATPPSADGGDLPELGSWP